jgi:cytochrome c peroxidase
MSILAGVAGVLALAAAWRATASAPPAAWPALAGYEPMAIPPDNPMTRGKVELGRQLFFDPRLSGDGSTACVTCHRPEHGLTDPRGTSVGAYGVPSGRSCPTLWNVGYQQAFFWEGAVPTLERAVFGVWKFILAPAREGQPDVVQVAARLNAVDGYRRQFVSVFGEDANVDNVPKALAAFLRTLVADRSAWVRFHAGEANALSTRARTGWAIFDGKAGCTQCHNGVLLTDLQYHNVGIGSRAEKPEVGRWGGTKNERDRGAFKTPTLLNVGRSAPYFHDGSVPTLEEAVDLMAGGGIPNPHLDGALKPVPLTPSERAALLAFLRELDVEFRESAPSLPR